MENPELYTQNLTSFRDLAKKLFHKYVKLLSWNDAEAILDVGIGDGSVTNEIVLPNIPVTVEEYIGCDISEKMLEFSQKIISHEKFRTMLLDITSENISDEFNGRFDHIFAIFVFHYLSNVSKAIENIHKMLKPGGQLLFITVEETPMDESYDKLDQGKWAKYNNKMALSSFYHHSDPKSEYEKIINKLGFKIVQLISEPCKIVMSNDSLIKLLESVNLRLPFVEEEERSEYIQDFINGVMNGKLVNVFPSEEKTLITLNMLIGVVTKT